MSRTFAIASAFAAIALAAPAMASERDHDERGARLQDERGARILLRGGWDGNGPGMFGTVEEDRGTRLLYRGGRGGWDANGPDSIGAEINLEGLVLEAIELPDGKRLGAALD